MSFLVICAVALLASALTFFSGFGLGTLLLPAFALFVPIEQAVALTAIVHLLNSLFKLLLTGKHADWRVVFVTDELRLTHGDTGATTCVPVGQHFYSVEMTDFHRSAGDWRVRQ